jgi:hypothetical protein
MMNTQPTPPRQVLLRLPEDLAIQLSRAIRPRQRNAFLVELIRQRLEQEDAELVAACEYMNQIEAQDPTLVQEADEWLNAPLSAEADALDDEFDREEFEREFALAQARHFPEPKDKAST